LDTMVEVRNLKKWFWTASARRGIREAVRALDEVSFSIKKREVLGLVGESGCGKTTCGKLILRIVDPTGGRVFFDGQDITHLGGGDMRRFRKRMMIIYQDPFGSLDPRMTVKKAIAEPMLVHRTVPRALLEDRVIELMGKVGLSADLRNRYPHEFSGGQRQRIGIARALAINPEFVVADEAVSALDVSIQAQILNLLQDLQKEFGITLLFIPHYLSVIRHISDRVAVMYLGKIVELAPKKALYEDPKHPYTKALLSAIPVPDPKKRRNDKILMGDVPSPVNPPPGCRFHPRCPYRIDPCDKEIPPLLETNGISTPAESQGSGHEVACHLYTRA
jgi:oligopeptide transport system ATP-binding protein